MPNKKDIEAPALIDVKSIVKANKVADKQLKKDMKEASKRGDYGEAASKDAAMTAHGLIEEALRDALDSEDNVPVKAALKALNVKLKDEKRSFRECKKDDYLFEAAESGEIISALEAFIEQVEKGQHQLKQ